MRALIVLAVVGCAPAVPVCVDMTPTCPGDEWALCMAEAVPGDCVGGRVRGAVMCDADGNTTCRSSTATPACVDPSTLECP